MNRCPLEGLYATPVGSWVNAVVTPVTLRVPVLVTVYRFTFWKIGISSTSESLKTSRSADGRYVTPAGSGLGGDRREVSIVRTRVAATVDAVAVTVKETSTIRPAEPGAPRSATYRLNVPGPSVRSALGANVIARGRCKPTESVMYTARIRPDRSIANSLVPRESMRYRRPSAGLEATPRTSDIPGSPTRTMRSPSGPRARTRMSPSVPRTYQDRPGWSYAMLRGRPTPTPANASRLDRASAKPARFLEIVDNALGVSTPRRRATGSKASPTAPTAPGTRTSRIRRPAGVISTVPVRPSECLNPITSSASWPAR